MTTEPKTEEPEYNGVAIVTTTRKDTGEVLGVAECLPDNYVLVTGPDMYVDTVQVYANGTQQITVKKERK